MLKVTITDESGKVLDEVEYHLEGLNSSEITDAINETLRSSCDGCECDLCYDMFELETMIDLPNAMVVCQGCYNKELEAKELD